MSHTSPPTVFVTSRQPATIFPRVVGALLLLGIALIHGLDLGGKLAEVPYLGLLYIALITGSVLAAALLFVRPRAGWALGGTLALLTFAGYCVNRTVGLPGAVDDIGNWGEPLGVASLVVEGMMILLSAAMLGLRRGGRRDGATVTTE